MIGYLGEVVATIITITMMINTRAIPPINIIDIEFSF